MYHKTVTSRKIATEMAWGRDWRRGSGLDRYTVRCRLCYGANVFEPKVLVTLNEWSASDRMYGNTDWCSYTSRVRQQDCG